MEKVNKQNALVTICTVALSIITGFNGYEIKTEMSAMVQIQQEMLYIEKNVSSLDERVNYLYARLIYKGEGQ